MRLSALGAQTQQARAFLTHQARDRGGGQRPSPSGSASRAARARRAGATSRPQMVLRGGASRYSCQAGGKRAAGLVLAREPGLAVRTTARSFLVPPPHGRLPHGWAGFSLQYLRTAARLEPCRMPRISNARKWNLGDFSQWDFNAPAL